MKLLKPGDPLILPGAENKIGLTVIGYEKDEYGNIIGYKVGLENESFSSEKPVIKANIEQ